MNEAGRGGISIHSHLEGIAYLCTETPRKILDQNERCKQELLFTTRRGITGVCDGSQGAFILLSPLFLPWVFLLMRRSRWSKVAVMCDADGIVPSRVVW